MDLVSHNTGNRNFYDKLTTGSNSSNTGNQTMSNWTDTDKAQWILENGKPEYVWIFERNGNQVYRRPCPPVGKDLPPWLKGLPREPVLTQTNTEEKWEWAK